MTDTTIGMSNKPNLPSSGDYGRPLNMNREADRLNTFNSWTTNVVEKELLAKFGFYYKGPDDSVECIFCKVVIASWDIGDDPLKEHIHWAPSCPLLLKKPTWNLPLDANLSDRLPSSKFIQPIVTQPGGPHENQATEQIVLTGRDKERHPKFRDSTVRLKSFEKWPQALNQKPQKLSEAGLFYLGRSDHVKCYHCGGALRDWEENDDPVVEHAKFFPTCEFIQQLIATNNTRNSELNINDIAPMDVDNDEHIMQSNNIESVMKSQISDENFSKKCNICLYEDLNAVFIPCMHIYSCIKCGFSVSHCPVCRRKIDEIAKCYISCSDPQSQPWRGGSACV